jgi:hypothetical protein
MTIEWRKSSRSTGVNDEACVELARFAGAVGVRDSKHPERGHLALRPGQLSALMERIRNDG